MTEFSDSMTLAEARALLRQLVDEGATCPCCRQFAKVYKRKIHSAMARDLIKFWRAHRREYGHSTRTLGATAPDFVKLVHWGMIEAQPGERDDGSNRTGWWRITAEGERFVLGLEQAPSHVKLYDGRKLGMAGKWVYIQDALGRRFRYDELMGETDA